MAVIGKLYRTNDNIYGLYKKDLIELIHLNIVLVLDRYISSYDDNVNIVEYLMDENKQVVEETVFHYYFDLLEEVE